MSLSEPKMFPFDPPQSFPIPALVSHVAVLTLPDEVPTFQSRIKLTCICALMALYICFYIQYYNTNHIVARVTAEIMLTHLPMGYSKSQLVNPLPSPPTQIANMMILSQAISVFNNSPP